MYPYAPGSARLRERPRGGRLARVAGALRIRGGWLGQPADQAQRGASTFGALRLQGRWLAHLVVLLAVFLAALPGAAGVFGHEGEAAQPGSNSSRLSQVSPRRSGGLVENLAPTPAPTAVPTPTPAPPDWVQSHRAATLWSGPDDSASAVTQLEQWTRLRSLGPRTGGRLLVEESGDGFDRLPSRGWVDAADVGPSGPPGVEWRLGLHADRPGAPRWQGEAWPRGITAEFAVVLDGTSGQVLYGKNAHGQVAPASLTKIATAIVALEHASLSDTVSIEVDGSTMYESTVMGIRPGQRLSMKTLLYGLMLPSGNDAALAIAQHVGGSEAGFADMMNRLVARLELEDTHFVNPHGLDAPGHLSSPYDMAMLARYGMRIPAFADMSAARHYEGEGYQLWNLNKLLGSFEGADGVKPGFTDLAGRAVVGSATRDGHRVFVALMRSPDLWGDAIGLLNYAFRSFSWAD